MLFNDEKNNYEAGFWQIWWKKWNKKLLFRLIKFRIRDPTINWANEIERDFFFALVHF